MYKKVFPSTKKYKRRKRRGKEATKV